MTVFVLDGNENQAVACVRSLARAGYRVAVGAPTNWSKAGWSRHCSKAFRYPAPELGTGDFVNYLTGQIRAEPGALILPMTEQTTLALSIHRDVISSAGGRLVLPLHSSILRAFDKMETTRLAKSSGIASPETVLVMNETHASELAHSVRYPVVLKPRRSTEVALEGRTFKTGRPLYASNPKQFVAAYERLRGLGSDVLAQKYVEGTGYGYFALVKNGQILAEFGHCRLRDVHPAGSGSSLRLSVNLDPRLKAAGADILRNLDWHGVAMVEFRVTSDGTPVFMEVNGRFWASLALAVYAGMDFPLLLVRLAENGETTVPVNYRPGLRCRWIVGDMRHLGEVWLGPPAGYPGKFPKRLQTLISMMVPVPGTFHDNFSWRDPLPELGDWLDFGLRRLPNQIRAICRSECRHSSRGSGSTSSFS